MRKEISLVNRYQKIFSYKPRTLGEFIRRDPYFNSKIELYLLVLNLINGYSIFNTKGKGWLREAIRDREHGNKIDSDLVLKVSESIEQENVYNIYFRQHKFKNIFDFQNEDENEINYGNNDKQNFEMYNRKYFQGVNLESASLETKDNGTEDADEKLIRT
jgi:hypothetical protein